MLAVKLHKRPQAWLGKGSHLVPVISWKAARVQIMHWKCFLTTSYPTLSPNNKINYITLVRIPDDHPVQFFFTYGPSNFMKRVYWFDCYHPLRKWPNELKQALAEWWDAQLSGSGGLMVNEPRVILGKKLPKSCIKWTKDIRLLYGHRPPRKNCKDES